MALFEREFQLQELADMFATSARGHGQFALVDGGVASGKTELAHAVGQRAADAGALVLSATGSIAESTIRLGIVGQLCHSARSQTALGDDLMRLVGPGVASPAEPEGATLRHDDAQLLEKICQVLLEMGGDRPLVIVVDDVQFADPLSLQAMLYLQRRIRTAKVLLVLSGCLGAQPSGAAFRAELTRQPHCHHIRLRPLSRDGVRRLLADRLPKEAAEALSGSVHVLSGGSPVLVHALAEDFLAVPSACLDELVVGEAFVQAALACLHRSDPRLLDVSRALAILGPSAPADMLAALVHLKPAVVQHAVDALTVAGLSDTSGFRHPAVRAAVLTDCPSDVQSRLRSRAARLLHDAAAPASEVATHLVAAGERPAEWTVPVLIVAAEEALASGTVPHAIDCLELALTSIDGIDSSAYAAIEAKLVRVHWRDNPAAALRHISSLLLAWRGGHLGVADTLLLVRTLAWHGRADEAAEVFVRIDGPSVQPDPELAPDYRSTGEWLRHCHPRGEAGESLRDDGDVERAEQVLQSCRVGESVLVAAWQALRTLIHADLLDRAGDWCEQLIEEARTRHTASWRAVLDDVRAAIALRRGDLAAAERHAHAALAAMAARSWGISIVSPLAHLVLARTMTGQLTQAEELLWQVRPAAARHSLFWLQLLLARGAYYVAVDRLHAALADFETVGEHAVRWGVDVPAVFPWRIDLARVHLRLGRIDQARQLVQEQFAMSGADSPRTRGMGLRVLAAACEPRQRQALLREATGLLHASGDSHELAHAFADLSQTGHALGESGRAKMMGRRALQLAQRCDAEPLRQKLSPAYRESGAPGQRDGSAPSGLAALSEAERRVANLAALGHTNREIGNELFITVSTVEQHLTRAYRKLKISRRTDLVQVGPLGIEVFA